jgi:hypothetical protein
MSWRGYLLALALVISVLLLFQILFNPESALPTWWHEAWKWP